MEKANLDSFIDLLAVEVEQRVEKALLAKYPNLTANPEAAEQKDDPEWVRSKYIEKRYSVSRGTVHNWAKEGKIAKRKSNGVAWYSLPDAKKLFECPRPKTRDL